MPFESGVNALFLFLRLFLLPAVMMMRLVLTMTPQFYATTGAECRISRVLETAVKTGLCIARRFRDVKFRSTTNAKLCIISILYVAIIAFHISPLLKELLLDLFHRYPVLNLTGKHLYHCNAFIAATCKHECDERNHDS